MNYGLPNNFQGYGIPQNQFQGFNQGMPQAPGLYQSQSVQSVENQRTRLKSLGLDDSAIDNILGAKQGLLQARDDMKTDLRANIIGGTDSTGSKVASMFSSL
tara:strand:- start:101 stop:406 length:306 start_codon:yes stop_codon:yes gene_type:complete